MNSDKCRIDMCRGPLFRQIVRFSVPLVLSGMLQLMFNAADLVVLGRFAPHQAMAAVGATAALIALIVNVFMGLSVGANALAAVAVGAHDNAALEKTVHTAMLAALLGGIALGAVGWFAAAPVLDLICTPPDVFPHACRYMRIFCCGFPFLMLFNFGSAIMRSAGDTRRPLFYLIAAGTVNLLLNVLLVAVFHLDAAGVAFATAVSHGISAALVLLHLLRVDGGIRLRPGRLRIDGGTILKMLGVGLPAGIQGSFFAVSNLVIQSTVNSFGEAAMAGNTAAVSLESIVYTCSYSLHQAAITFTGQNLGGCHPARMRRGIICILLCSLTICELLGLLMLSCGDRLLSFYTCEPEVVRWGMLRMKLLFSVYFFYAALDVFGGSLRGLGHAVMPAASTMVGICLSRVLWVNLVFPQYRTMESLMISYPVSWGLTALFNGLCLWFICHKIFSGGRRGCREAARLLR